MEGVRVYGVVAKLDVCVASRILVGAGNIGRPVADIFRTCAPETCFFRRVTRRVDVKVRGGRVPVRRSRYGNSCAVHHTCRNQHSLVPRKHSLAERDHLATLVDGLDRSNALNTVRLVREWLDDVSGLVAVQSSVHGFRVHIRRPLLPLVHYHSRLASKGAV